jgi:membrane fusion protein, copper/silver efflux system
MKSFIAVMTALFILSFSAVGQEMKSQQHQMDSTKVEKHMMHKQHKDTAKIDKYTCPMHPEVITHKPGKCPKCGMTLVKIEVKKVKEESKKTMEMKSEVYTCPMHPDVKSDMPGKCPKCKMKLVLVKEKNDK